MKRPRLLDLFCGAGGASMGFTRAGFDVTGVDIEPQLNYPFAFHQADATTFPLDGFDAIHASPPCQHYSRRRPRKERQANHPDLLLPTLLRLREHHRQTGTPYMIENVENAAPLKGTAILLCGTMFRLGVFRHRLFRCSFPILAPAHGKHRGKVGDGLYVTVAGNSGGIINSGSRRVQNGSLADWRKAMGIDWMNVEEIAQAIPPAYTAFLGRVLLHDMGRQPRFKFVTFPTLPDSTPGAYLMLKDGKLQ